jgi:ATP-dependent protease ClpP protease subunit
MKTLELFDGAVPVLDFFAQEIRNAAGQKILLQINSAEVDAALAFGVLALLQLHGAGFETHILGVAGGGAAFLACAGSPVRMAENALLVPSRAKERCVGESADMRKVADRLDQWDAAILALFQRKTKLPAGRIKEMMNAEVCMAAPAAKEAGFVDEVTGAAAVAHASAPRVAALAELHRKFSLAARSDSRRASALWEQIKRFRRDPGP